MCCLVQTFTERLLAIDVGRKQLNHLDLDKAPYEVHRFPRVGPVRACFLLSPN